MATEQELAILIKAQNLTQAAFTAARKDMASLGTEATKLSGPLSSTNSQFQTIFSTLKGAAGLVGVTLGVSAVVGFAKAVFDAADDIGDMAEQFDLSIEAVQRFKFAAEQSGATMDTVGNAIKFMSRALGEGDTGLRAALADVGLSFTTIRAMRPEDAFRAMAEAVRAIQDPMEQARVGTLLFGKAWSDLAPTIKAGVDDVGKAAHVMSDETVGSLKSAKDAWGTVSNAVITFTGTVLAEGMKQLNIFQRVRDSYAELQATLGVSFSAPEAMKAPATPSLFKGQKPQDVGLKGAELDDVTSSLNEQRVALDAAATKANAHATAIRNLRDELTGKGTIRAALDMVSALKGVSLVQIDAAGNTDRVNKAMRDGIDVFTKQGQVAPQAMRDLYGATVQLPPVMKGIAAGVGNIGEEIDLVIPKTDAVGRALEYVAGIPVGVKIGAQIALVPPKLQIATDGLGMVSRALSDLGIVAGGTFGAVTRGLSTVVSAFDSAMKAGKALNDGLKAIGDGAVVAGLTGVAGALASIAAAGVQVGKGLAPLLSLRHGKLGELLGTNAMGRSMVEDFAEMMGGFDALHEKLLLLGDAGEALWIKLTQGVGRANTKQAQEAIDEVTKALEEQEAQQAKTGSATEEQAAATIETASQAEAALEGLGVRLKTNADEWHAWGDTVTGILGGIAATVRGITLPSPTGTPAPGFAGGTHGAFLDFGSGTPVILHGRERVMTESEGRSGQQPIVVQSVVQVDGREIARVSAKYQRAVLAPYGVR